MPGTPDISTVELSRTRIKLRDDLLFVPQQYGGEIFYHLEVKTAAEYYRIGYAEYVFVSLLDGRTSFAEALAIASQQLTDKALSQAQAMSIYSWLLDNGLGAFADADTSASGASSAVRATGEASFWKKFNPLWMKIALGRPESLLRSLNPLAGWLFSGPATLGGLVLMVIAGLTLRSNWEQFSAATANVIARENWLYLFAAWVGLKIFHELAHGLVCYRYGGTIRETGVVIAFLAPLAYVDASSSWSFRSRWHRIHTALAGIHFELLIASVAVISWTQCESPVLRHVLQNTIMMASVSTLLFNLNPLMKFDGYYVLSDLIEIPNLSSQANAAVLSLVQRFLFGHTGGAPVIVGRQRWLLLTYGVLALGWRLLVSLSLLIMASVLYHGAGLTIAALGVCIWFGGPLWRSLSSLGRLWLQHPERLFRAAVAGGAVLMVLIAGLYGLPSPVVATSPGVVDFTHGEVIRSATSGFVETVHVVNGQNVVEGELLISLRNDDVQTQFNDLEKQLAQEVLRLQTASSEHNSGALNVSQGNLESLSMQLDECRKRLDGLQIRASRVGQVVGRNLHSLKGTFATAGMELLTIGRNDHKEFQLSLSQRDLTLAASLVGQPVRVRIGTHSAVTATLLRVNPRASRAIPHPAMAATNGGPLAVAENHDNANSGADKRLQLTEHRFTAVVQLPPQQADEFFSGERGIVALGLQQGSLGTHVWRAAHDWLTKQLAVVNSSKK